MNRQNLIDDALEALREVSRCKSDFDDLSPVELADILQEYWSEWELTADNVSFLNDLRKLEES